MRYTPKGLPKGLGLRTLDYPCGVKHYSISLILSTNTAVASTPPNPRTLTRSGSGDKLNLGLRGLAATRRVCQDRTCHFPAERQHEEQVLVCRVLCHRDGLDLLLGALANLQEESNHIDRINLSSAVNYQGKKGVSALGNDAMQCMVPNRSKFVPRYSLRLANIHVRGHPRETTHWKQGLEPIPHLIGNSHAPGSREAREVHLDRVYVTPPLQEAHLRDAGNKTQRVLLHNRRQHIFPACGKSDIGWCHADRMQHCWLRSIPR